MSGAKAASHIIPGKWIVRLKPYATEKAQLHHRSAVNARTADNTPFSCEIHREYNLDEARAYFASFDVATKEQIEQLNDVAAVEPVQLYKHCLVTQDNAPWGLARVSNRGKLTGQHKYQYNAGAAGQGVKAYVLDTGINDKHVQFENRAIRGPKFVTEPHPDTVTNDEDNQGHGTHCAGTIASRDYGVAKKVEVIGIKVFNDLPEEDAMAGATNADIMRALEYVVTQYRDHKKPSVVNLSLGGGTSDALDATVAATVRAGVTVCCAAGNGRPPMDADTTSPGRTPLAITVAASDERDHLADFSFYGKLVDIIAPGVDIESTWIGSNEITETLSGTSMACPHVVGIACTILSNPNVVDKTPHNTASELLILADKNTIPILEEKKKRTVNAVGHISV
ncbi:peptidase S8/S53 domain-containing protein [Parachaetomium inaequale]|uniref:Peptidase S8/S53 domain-containing protein n=1 Tax=Parachaetomium inaequale TaxID=2588326 RepID=A0AAN6SL82_9PEZI|nr:peptidase S8/S53 domain-containing protein [Parachaetomium inaequale]